MGGWTGRLVIQTGPGPEGRIGTDGMKEGKMAGMTGIERAAVLY